MLPSKIARANRGKFVAAIAHVAARYASVQSMIPKTQQFFDFRRMRIRNTLLPPEDPDQDSYTFTQGLGNNHELNWTINMYGMTPSVCAFRNLHLRGLYMRAKGAVDKTNKAFKVQVPELDYDLYYVSALTVDPRKPVPQILSDVKLLSEDSYKQLNRQVRFHLSDIPDIYVHDGAFGSNRTVESRFRAFGDGGNAGLVLRSLLTRIPLGAPRAYEHPLTALIVPTISLADPGKFGLASSRFVVVNPATRFVIVGGVGSVAAIRDALRLLAECHYALRTDALIVRADSLVSDSGTRTVLVFGMQDIVNSIIGGGANALTNVFGAHLNLWSADGLARAWNSVSTSAQSMPLKFGDLIETYKSRTMTTVFHEHPIGNIAPHPSAVFFVNEKSGAPQKLNEEEAVKQFAEHHKSAVANEVAIKQFAERLKQHNVAAYTVGSGQPAKEAIMKALKA